jgi:hypothetical protein
MMRTMNGNCLSTIEGLVRSTNLPFSTKIEQLLLWAKFKMPQIEMNDGSKDHVDHLEKYKAYMHWMIRPSPPLQRDLDADGL